MTTPLDANEIARIREAVATYDDLTSREYETDAEMEATYPAAKAALRAMKDAVPALLAEVERLRQENAWQKCVIDNIGEWAGSSGLMAVMDACDDTDESEQP